jgi:hypothetical protein
VKRQAIKTVVVVRRKTTARQVVSLAESAAGANQSSTRRAEARQSGQPAKTLIAGKSRKDRAALNSIVSPPRKRLVATQAKASDGTMDASCVVTRQRRKLATMDRELVDRCMAGEPNAWSLMYERFHASLMSSIRAFLGRAGHDFHTIEEIAARVWYALIRNDFELLSKFDAARNCRLSTFLSMLAKTEARLLIRSERRRKTREQAASKTEHDGHKPRQTGEVLSEQEFLSTLTPAERTFYADVLIGTDDAEAHAQYTQHNLWQLRHRVRKKLERFLEDAP